MSDSADSACVISPCLETIQYTHKLVIQDFENLTNVYSNGEKLKSNDFRIPIKDSSLICVADIFVSGYDESNKDYLSVYLKCDSGLNAKFSYTVSVIDNEGQSRNVYSMKEKEVCKFKDGWGWNKFIKHSKLFESNSKLLNQGTLTLVFKVKIKQMVAVMKSNPVVEDEEMERTNKHNLFVMEKLYDDPVNYKSDFVIECIDNKEVHCHSIILNAASEYFQNMFATNTKERQEGRVFIKDLEKETCDIILKYIYTGKLDKKQVTVELYKKANYLRLIELRDICSNYLMKNITNEDCVAAYLFADSIKDLGLKEACADFIEENTKDVADKLKIIQDPEIWRRLYLRRAKLDFL